MTPTDASISSLSTDFTQLTTKSEDQLPSNDGSVLYEGKQVAVVNQNNSCDFCTMVLMHNGSHQFGYS